jgi:hypothetical protein
MRKPAPYRKILSCNRLHLTADTRLWILYPLHSLFPHVCQTYPTGVQKQFQPFQNILNT